MRFGKYVITTNRDFRITPARSASYTGRLIHLHSDPHYATIVEREPSTTTADSRAASRRQRLIFVAILGVAAALRFWGLGFGLPNTVTRPDENIVVGTAAGFTIRRTLNPGFFSYPSLYLYVLGGLDAAGCAGGILLRVFPDINGCTAAWARNWTPVFMTARIVTATTGIAAVAAVVAIGRRLYPLAGWFAAIFLAVAFLHVRDSHYGATDVPMTTILLAAVLLIQRAHEQPSRGRFLIAGLVAGLAASTKYNAVLVGASAVLSQLVAWVFPGDRRDVRHTQLFWFTIAAASGFLIGTPYALIAPSRVWHDAHAESLHLLGGHAGIRLDIAWRYHALVTLPHGLGWPLFLTGAVGVLMAFARKPREAGLIFAFPIIYYFVAGRGYTVFTRYMIPVVPFLCLGAGAAIAAVIETGGPGTIRIRRLVAVALAVLCALPTASKAIALDRILSRTDSRVLVAQWLEARAWRGASILLASSSYGAPQLWRDGKPLPFEVLTWESDARRIIAGGRPDFILVEESGLSQYTEFPDALRPVLQDYDLQGVIHASDLQVPHVYDQQDAFYLPFDGFDGVERPGANFYIYRKRDRAAALLIHRTCVGAARFG